MLTAVSQLPAPKFISLRSHFKKRHVSLNQTGVLCQQQSASMCTHLIFILMSVYVCGCLSRTAFAKFLDGLHWGYNLATRPHFVYKTNVKFILNCDLTFHSILAQLQQLQQSEQFSLWISFKEATLKVHIQKKKKKLRSRHGFTTLLPLCSIYAVTSIWSCQCGCMWRVKGETDRLFHCLSELISFDVQ